MAIRTPSDAASINLVLAENLARFMRDKGLTQMTLAGKADMGETTVSLYLNPGRRSAGKSGKEPSAKLAEVQRLAKAIDVELWQLLQPSTLSALAVDLGRAFDELPLDEAKVRLYAKLMDDIRAAKPADPHGKPMPDDQSALSPIRSQKRLQRAA